MQYAHLAVYAIVMVVSLIKFPLYKDTSLKVLPIILLFTLLTESVGRFIVCQYGPPNVIIYNIYYFFDFSLFDYVFMKVIEEEKFKQYIKIGIVLYWLFYVWDWFFTDFIKQGSLVSYFGGAVILFLCNILYDISSLQPSLV